MTTLMSTHSLQMTAGHLPLFDHINLGIQSGDRLGLIGANGCGKSTLLALLAGELQPHDGRVQQAAPCRCEFVAQQLPARLSTLSTRAVLLDALGNDPAAEWQVDKLLAELQLEAQATLPVSALSGGQHSRLQIGRALLRQPNLLLLDEPFSALDSRSRIHQAHVLKGLQQESGIPMIFVSHAMEEVSLLCDQLVLLEGGRVEAQGRPSEIFARTDLSLASRDDAGVMLDATLAHYDNDEQMATLQLGEQRLRVTMTHVPDESGPLQIKVAGRDVVIATAPIEHSSLSNCLVTRLLAVREVRPGQTLLQLALGEQILLARITSRSARRLALAPEQQIYAYIKAVSLVSEG